MSLDGFIAIGREKKVKRFAAHFDGQIVEGGADPMLPATAAVVAEQLRTSPEEAWKKLAKDMGEKSTPSEESRLGIVNLYRVRASLAPLDSLSGEPAPLPAIVTRYIDLIDARATRKGRDPHDVKTAEAIAELLGNYKSAGQWMTLKIELRERFVPERKTRHDVVNVYRVRAGLVPREWPKVEVRKCLAGCGKDARADSDVCSSECDAKVLSGSISDASRAEQLDVQDEIDREQERKQRFGGGGR